MCLRWVDLNFLLTSYSFATTHHLLLIFLVAIGDIRPFIRVDAHLIPDWDRLVIVAYASRLPTSHLVQREAFVHALFLKILRIHWVCFYATTDFVRQIVHHANIFPTVPSLCVHPIDVLNISVSWWIIAPSFCLKQSIIFIFWNWSLILLPSWFVLACTLFTVFNICLFSISMDIMNAVKSFFFIIRFTGQIYIIIDEDSSTICWTNSSIVSIATSAIRLAIWMALAWDNLAMAIVWRLIFLVVALMFPFVRWLLRVDFWLLYYAICIEVLLLRSAHLLLGICFERSVYEYLRLWLVKVIWVWIMLHHDRLFLLRLMSNFRGVNWLGLENTRGRTCSLLWWHVTCDRWVVGW